VIVASRSGKRQCQSFVDKRWVSASMEVVTQP
jgi:hypothetical protein